MPTHGTVTQDQTMLLADSMLQGGERTVFRNSVFTTTSTVGRALALTLIIPGSCLSLLGVFFHFVCYCTVSGVFLARSWMVIESPVKQLPSI